MPDRYSTEADYFRQQDEFRTSATEAFRDEHGPAVAALIAAARPDALSAEQRAAIRALAAHAGVECPL